MNKLIDMKKLMERLENINEEGFDDDNNKDTHIYALARVILSQVNSTAQRSMVEKDSETYEALLAKHIDNVTNMIRNDISHIRESDRAFAESLSETTGEQYEVMLDKAGDLGEMIAENVILDKSTDPSLRSNPEYLNGVIDKHITVVAKRMTNVAHKYISVRLTHQRSIK